MTLSEQIQGQRRSSKKSKSKAQAAANTAQAAANANPRTKPEAQQRKGRKSSAGTGSAMAATATAAKDPKRDRRSTLPATRDAAAAEAAPASGSGKERERGLRGSFRALRRSTEDLSNAATAIKKTIGSFVRSSPLRRSFSFGRDLNKVGGLRKTAWSASLQSLREDVPEEEAVAAAGAAGFLAEDKRDSFIEDEEDAELAEERRAPARNPADAVVGVPTGDLEFKTRSLVIEDSGAFGKDPEFQDLPEASRRRTQSYSAVQKLGVAAAGDEADTGVGRRVQRPLSASAQLLPGEGADPLELELELERLLPAGAAATLPRKPVRQNSDSVFSRGFWHDLFSSKGRSLSLSHIEQAGVEPQQPTTTTLSSSAGISPAARGASTGMCVSVGPGFPGLGAGLPPAAVSAPAASPAAACLDVPGADGGGGGEPPPGQDRGSGPGLTTVTSFVGSSRRHRLVRSQVNSSEYFSVSFELAGGGDAGPDEFVAACRGVTLGEALQASCGRRGVDVRAVVAHVDDARAPLSADSAALAGRHVRVTVRDGQSPARSSSKDSTASSAQLLKSASEQSYDRGWSSGRSLFSVSTDEGGEPEAAPSRADRGAGGGGGRAQGAAPKQRWSSLFSNSKDTKMEALVEQLKQYSENGIPRHVRAEPDDYEAHREELEQVGRSDWREWLCGGGAELTERRRQQQAALWELLATEAAYVQVIHVVTRLFLACLRSLQGSGLLVEVDASRLFCNVESVAAASLAFWVRHLAPAVAGARLRALPLDPLHLRDGFLRFHETFQPYTRYCAEQLNCQAYCREMCRKDELFAAYLAWCEAQPACGRLRLADLLVKPMQRLTRYSLLLRAVLRHTDDEHHATALARMITSVDEFVNNVNSSLKTKQDNEKLKALIARIESYDVVEAVKDEELERLVRVHSQLDLTAPMPGCHVSQPRQLLLESDLKLREGAASKTDVRCVLVTDALLVCKPAGRRRGAASRAGAALRVVRPPYLVERLRVSELASGLGVAVVYLSEWRSAVHAFTLSSNDPRTVRVWVEAVQRAQDLYATARMAWSPAPQLPSHSPRLESSRSSRLSSLAHSHSSSLEMNEASSLSSASQSQSREASVDINRGSSVSSDEGLLMPHAAAAGDSRQATSPRSDRRSRLLSPTPSSLCLLQPPSFQSGLGQSLPNLTLGGGRAADVAVAASLASRSVTPTPRSSPAAPCAPSGSPVLGHSPPASLLLVPGQAHGAIRKQRHAQPQHLLSPGHRGVSYPPPSPCRGSLQRTTPVPQSRNPPLVKTGHVASVGCLGPQQRLSDLGVPLIAGVSPPSDERPSPGDYSGDDVRGPSQSPGAGPVDACISSAADSANGNGNGNGKRLGRADNRRYKTAGAIDDIKKQESRDCSIHKRLSWNCGRQQQPGAAAGAGSGGGSQESVRSSSGVSSGGSAGCLLPQGAEPVQEVVYEWRRAPSCPPPQAQQQLFLGAGGYYPQGGTPPLSPRAVPLEAVNVEMVQPMRTPETNQGASGTPTPRAATPSPTPLEHQPHHRHQHHQRRPPGGLQRMKDAIVMDSPADGSNV